MQFQINPRLTSVHGIRKAWRKYFKYFKLLVIIAFLFVVQSYLSTVDFNIAFISKLNTKFIISTGNCKIPDFYIWNPELLPLFRKAEIQGWPSCHQKVPKWSHIHHLTSHLVLNKTRIEEDGHNFTELDCCYIVIERPEDFDNYVRYSPCRRINHTRTKIATGDEFIIVECHNSNINSSLVYRMFHALPSTAPDLENKTQADKYPYNRHKPPNVIILMQDSTSRLNFQRYMNKTKGILKSIGAVEMMGHAKVGDCTYENAIPFLTGYRAYEDLPEVCLNGMGCFDECPFIWKEFKEAGYLTGLVEDTPSGHLSSNLGGTYGGFKSKPTDFYTRPFFLAVHEHEFPLGKRHPSTDVDEWMKCIGYQTNTEFMLEYLDSSLDLANQMEMPLFNVHLSATASHDFISGIKNEDEVYAQFLLRLIRKGHLKNTILFVMGDHGYRYGPIRETLQGEYEDNLPNMWIYLPPWIRQNYPHWHQGLLYNSQRLTSHFMLYWSMQRILNEFAPKGRDKPTTDFRGIHNKTIKRHFKHDFFHPLPDGFGCKDLGIPSRHCPCHEKSSLPENDALLVNATSLAMKYLNEVLVDGSKCAELALGWVQSGNLAPSESTASRYIIKMETTPGKGLFEAEVNYDLNINKFIDVDIKRINAINKNHVRCLKGKKDGQLYCYCKE